ncbi:uncharacterized protein [Amphiura filiformis]|uniref:uncharacterized protein n=1 Tax=Amphiura filiformis TaxID=82378 RepID=UPI003B21B776
MRTMEHKNINRLTIPNGGTDSESGTHQSVENGGPASSDSLRSTPEPSPPFNSESFARRRASSLSLTPLKIPAADNQQFAGGATAGAAAAVAASDPEVEECAEEGFEHFTEFLVNEIERNGMQPPPDLQEDIVSARVQHTGSQTDPPPSMQAAGPPTATPTGYKHPQWAKRGKGLRKLADDFAQTRERKKVQEKASGVEADSISWREFQDLLSELFPRGIITRERIVVLFFFCTDLAICMLQQDHLELFHRFVRWTLQYIRNTVCTWVANQGGWGAVLATSIDYLRRGAQIAAAGLLLYFAYKLVTNATSNTSNK